MSNIAILANSPVTMNSREIAELAGKDHSNVMRDIRALMQDLEQASNLNPFCESTTYQGINGQKYPQYELDKDTCLTLLLGYDPVARMKVVKRWQELEADVGAATVPQSFAQALRLAAEQQEEIERQQLALEQAKPKLVYADTMLNAEGTVLVRDAAKTIGVPVRKLESALRKKGVILSNNAPAAEYVTKGYFQEGLHPYKTKTRGVLVNPVARVTGKGLEFLRRFANRHAAMLAAGKTAQ